MAPLGRIGKASMKAYEMATTDMTCLFYKEMQTAWVFNCQNSLYYTFKDF